ncbi:MAG: hypothetical protein ACE5GJ_01890 [Gemmatimonadota bacterium]
MTSFSRNREALFLLGLAGLLLATPAAVFAQEQEAGPPQQQPQTELVFEREAFVYPTFQRRNPFKPLVAADQGGPRFEQLRLMGVIYSDDPAESVAILGTYTVSVSEDGTQVTVSEDGKAWYLKTGQSVGNTRVLEIHPQEVVVEVEEFGLTEQRIMQLQTRPTGGTP